MRMMGASGLDFAIAEIIDFKADFVGCQLRLMK
jgi:hypothetical protein